MLDRAGLVGRIPPHATKVGCHSSLSLAPLGGLAARLKDVEECIRLVICDRSEVNHE